MFSAVTIKLKEKSQSQARFELNKLGESQNLATINYFGAKFKTVVCWKLQNEYFYENK